MNGGGISDRWTVFGGAVYILFRCACKWSDMESDPTVLGGFIFIFHRRSNDVGVKCLSLSLCAFHSEDSLSVHKELAQFTFFRFTKLDLSYFVLPF